MEIVREGGEGEGEGGIERGRERGRGKERERERKMEKVGGNEFHHNSLHRLTLQS